VGAGVGGCPAWADREGAVKVRRAVRVTSRGRCWGMPIVGAEGVGGCKEAGRGAGRGAGLWLPECAACLDECRREGGRMGGGRALRRKLQGGVCG